uniref:Uncharacterized protein n=1 Tax=Moniliophthora roreri TaxID=221103 RepID=A0A0W0FY81_MONRR
MSMLDLDISCTVPFTNEGLSQNQEHIIHNLTQYLEDLAGHGRGQVGNAHFLVLVAWRDRNDQLETHGIAAGTQLLYEYLELLNTWQETNKSLPSNHISLLPAAFKKDCSGYPLLPVFDDNH